MSSGQGSADEWNSKRAERRRVLDPTSVAKSADQVVPAAPSPALTTTQSSVSDSITESEFQHSNHGGKGKSSTTSSVFNSANRIPLATTKICSNLSKMSPSVESGKSNSGIDSDNAGSAASSYPSERLSNNDAGEPIMGKQQISSEVQTPHQDLQSGASVIHQTTNPLAAVPDAKKERANKPIADTTDSHSNDLYDSELKGDHITDTTDSVKSDSEDSYDGEFEDVLIPGPSDSFPPGEASSGNEPLPSSLAAEMARVKEKNGGDWDPASTGLPEDGSINENEGAESRNGDTNVPPGTFTFVAQNEEEEERSTVNSAEDTQENSTVPVPVSTPHSDRATAFDKPNSSNTAESPQEAIPEPIGQKSHPVVETPKSRMNAPLSESRFSGKTTSNPVVAKPKEKLGKNAKRRNRIKDDQALMTPEELDQVPHYRGSRQRRRDRKNEESGVLLVPSGVESAPEQNTPQASDDPSSTPFTAEEEEAMSDSLSSPLKTEPPSRELSEVSSEGDINATHEQIVEEHSATTALTDDITSGSSSVPTSQSASENMSSTDSWSVHSSEKDALQEDLDVVSEKSGTPIDEMVVTKVTSHSPSFPRATSEDLEFMSSPEQGDKSTETEKLPYTPEPQTPPPQAQEENTQLPKDTTEVIPLKSENSSAAPSDLLTDTEAVQSTTNTDATWEDDAEVKKSVGPLTLEDGINTDSNGELGSQLPVSATFHQSTAPDSEGSKPKRVDINVETMITAMIAAKMKGVEEQMQTLVAGHADLNTKNQQLVGQVSSMQTNVDKLGSENKSLRGDIDKLNVQLGKTQEAKIKLEKRLRDANEAWFTNRQKLEKKLETARKAQDELSTSNAILQGENRDLERNNAALYSSNGGLAYGHFCLQMQKSGLARENEVLKNKNQVLNDQKVAWERVEKTKLTSERDALARKNSDLNKEWASKNLSLTTDLQQKERDHEITRAALAKSNSRLSSAKLFMFALCVAIAAVLWFLRSHFDFTGFLRVIRESSIVAKIEELVLPNQGILEDPTSHLSQVPLPSIGAMTRLQGVVSPLCHDGFSTSPDFVFKDTEIISCGINLLCWAIRGLRGIFSL